MMWLVYVDTRLRIQSQHAYGSIQGCVYGQAPLYAEGCVDMGRLGDGGTTDSLGSGLHAGHAYTMGAVTQFKKKKKRKVFEKTEKQGMGEEKR